MEDYDVIEINNVKDKTIVLVIEDDEMFITNNLLNSNIEVMPLRLNYDLSNFKDDYILKTKELFTYYYNDNNIFESELLRLKKHFIHYQRKPVIAYIPKDSKYDNIRKMLKMLDIKCISNKKELIGLLNRKLVLIDSDETLRKTNGNISKRVIKSIKKNRKKGNIIVICTARPRYQAIEVMNEACTDDIIISSNGSEIYDSRNNKVIYNSFIDNDEIIKLVEYAFLKDIRIVLSCDDFDFVSKNVRNSKQILLTKDNYKNELINHNIKQCMFIGKDITNIKKIISKNNKLSIVDENYLYEEKWISIINKDSSKGNALKFLANFLNIPINNTIAIGNNVNDISMFEAAGVSVAVANAPTNIKKMVDFVTLTNDEDGVAVLLESLLTEKQ